MSDIEFPEIPPDILVRCEQAFAEANQLLDTMTDNIRDAIGKREEILGIKDDSFHYAWLRDFIINNIAAHGSQVTAVVCAAAMFRLARAPRAEDPLAYLEETTEKREEE